MGIFLLLGIGLAVTIPIALIDSGAKASFAIPIGLLVGAALFFGLSALYINVFGDIYNQMVVARNEGEKRLLDIDTQLQRRADLVPQITAIAERFLSHERGTLESVIQARKQFDTTTGRSERIAAGDSLGSSLVTLFSVAESYPNIVSSTNIQSLHSELIATENQIAALRLEFNGTANRYNDLIESFPRNLFARLFGFTRESPLNVNTRNG